MRFSEAIPSSTDQVIQAIIATPISMPIGTVIGNMPEVKKKLFRSTYTREELASMQTSTVSVASKTNESDSEDDNQYQRPSFGSRVSSIDTQMVPDYVLVEASQGRVTQCFRVSGEHWTDPEVSNVQEYIEDIKEQSPEALDEDMLQNTTSRREYDRRAGIEHIRRDCPKVPVNIGDSHFLSLLDSGAELNTIRRETADSAMLPIANLPREMRSAKMVSANGTSGGFVGIVWGAQVQVGSIIVRTNFFVVEHCTNAIILGNPFLADARARLEYATNGLTYCRIWSERGEHSTRFVCTKGNLVNARGISTSVLGKVIGAQ